MPLRFSFPHPGLPTGGAPFFPAAPFTTSSLYPSAFKTVLPSMNSDRRPTAETNIQQTTSENGTDDVTTYTDITPPDSPELDPVGDD